MLEMIAELAGGGLLLYFGGDFLVRGSSSFALRKGVSLLVVGLTIVSMGTSAPELFVSLFAQLKGSGAISIGNVVGSNIANVGLVLGAAALIRPLRLRKSTLAAEIPIVLAASAVLWLTVADGRVGRLDGAVYLALFAGFLGYCFARRKSYVDEPVGVLPAKWMDWALIAGGVAGLYFGGELFVEGAKSLAKAFGASEFFIGLSVVALGTSLPELATSVIASLKKRDDISVGNVLGSNVFNIFFVLGIVSLIRPIGCGADSPSLMRLDLPVMAGVVLLLWPLGFKGRLGRGAGALLLAMYVVYIAVIAVRG